MTLPPLPDTPCVRVNLNYNEGIGEEGGQRFFLSYSGSAPTGANCATLASDIAAAWNTNLAAIPTSNCTLTSVDVQDIATRTGASGVWTGSHVGTNSGTHLPVQCAVDVEFNIAERYRGGKPRTYFYAGSTANQQDAANWNSTYISGVNSAVAAFFAAVTALSVGSMGTLAHVVLSYYQGFHNITNSSGRTRAVPTYRSPNAIHYNVLGYSCKALIGSQKRRRTATTP